MLYDVQMYAVVRVKVSGVSASSHREALDREEGAVDFDQLFSTCRHVAPVSAVEYADDVAGYMVDRVDQDELVDTRSYDYREGELVER